MLEREIKLGVTPGFELPPLDRVAEGVVAAPTQETRLETVYYDTPDLRLARWGCSLRFRQRQGWTLKLPQPSDGPALVRRELEFPGDGSHPPEAATALVQAYIRRSSLVPVATLSTRRRIVQLKNAAGALQAEVVDDDVSVIQGLRVANRFREVEVELREPGADVLIEPVLAMLKAAGASDLDPTPKHLRALGPRAAGPPEVSTVELGPNALTSEIVRNSIADSVATLMRHDPGVRLGDDPEDVHRARVATRRLRSQLRSFRTVLQPEWSDPLRDELRWLADQLGAVRDRQVMAARVRSRLAEVPASDRPIVGELARQLTAESEEVRARLVLDLRSDRYINLLEKLIEASRTPALLPGAAQPGAQVVPQLVRRDWKKLRSAVRALPDEPADADLHRVRILAKRARYAAEAARPIGVQKSVAFAKAAAELQGVLGDHQDSVNAQAWLRDTGTGRAAFAAGELAAIEQFNAREVRSEWTGKWKLLDRKRLRRWMI
jgi:CHAD domain-containing protein